MPTLRPRSLAKSPLALAHEALAADQRTPPPQSCRLSRNDYIRTQFLAILVPKQFFRTAYRGVVRLLANLAELRRALVLLC